MISVIILAAGKSTRMGRNKLLLKLEGKPAIRRVVEEALKSRADEVIVVLGHEAQKVREVLAELRCRFVENANYEEGQSSSVKAGLQHARPEASAVVIIPGDVFSMKAGWIDGVIREHEKTRAPIVVASYRGISGHPILLDKTLFPEIMKISEKTFGLKQITGKYVDATIKVEMDSEAVLLDVDTQDDLNRLGKLSS